MSKNRIFIIEFVSGGGFNQNDIPNSLFCEGFAMLRSIIADFKLLDFEILTMLDNRVLFLSQFLDADIIHKIDSKDNFFDIFKKLINLSKFVFIIAPESSKILYNLTKIAESYNVTILSTNLRAIKYGTSKMLTFKLFEKRKITTPKTYKIPHKNTILDKNFIIRKFQELKCPIVIKPVDGVGAELIHYFKEEAQILSYFEKLNNLNTFNREYILQEFIEGKDLSISLIGTSNISKIPLILSINFQDINIKDNISEYLGGYTPVEGYREKVDEISKVLKKIKSLKFQGYYGIDFIENHQKSIYFIEINPRLTTSYIGLKNIIKSNCAELILNSKLNLIKDPEIEIQDYSYFTRIDFYYNDNEELDLCHEELIPRLIKEIPELITPPISLSQSNNFSIFIATKTNTLSSSKLRLSEIIQLIQRLNFTLIKPTGIKLS